MTLLTKCKNNWTLWQEIILHVQQMSKHKQNLKEQMFSNTVGRMVYVHIIVQNVATKKVGHVDHATFDNKCGGSTFYCKEIRNPQLSWQIGQDKLNNIISGIYNINNLSTAHSITKYVIAKPYVMKIL